MDRDEVLKWLERRGTRATRDGMARYGLVASRAYGVPMGTLLSLARKLGTEQALSLALWESGWYEARLLAALVGDPERVTSRQMDAWARSFENWGDCDTVCFKLFDRTPLAWQRAPEWCASPREFVKRGGFVLMACLAAHDKAAPDEGFLSFLPTIERGALDERNFVKKGVSWALRMIGRRSLALNRAALVLAKRLASSAEPSARWVGKDALRELASSKVQAQLARRLEPPSPGKGRGQETNRLNAKGQKPSAMGEPGDAAAQARGPAHAAVRSKSKRVEARAVEGRPRLSIVRRPVRTRRPEGQK
jgi:3-methyladenine DNA glycosylase AlkD